MELGRANFDLDSNKISLYLYFHQLLNYIGNFNVVNSKKWIKLVKIISVTAKWTTHIHHNKIKFVLFNFFNGLYFNGDFISLFPGWFAVLVKVIKPLRVYVNINTNFRIRLFFSLLFILLNLFPHWSFLMKTRLCLVRYSEG